MPTLIRSSKHQIRPANTGKKTAVSTTVAEWQRVGALIIEDIWANGYLWEHEGVIKEFNVAKSKLEVPQFLDYNRFDIETTLAGRALSSLVTQIRGCLKASVEKQRKRLYILGEKKGNPRKQRKLLVKKVKTNIPQKPYFGKAKMEISSKNAEWLPARDEGSAFAGWLKLSALMKDQSAVLLPIKYTKHTTKLAALGGKRMGSFLVGKDTVDVRWELEEPTQREEGELVGADQGMKDVLMLSDGQVTPKMDKDKHTLESIMAGMVRKRKGSKAFRRAQAHRKNFINWSINQLDFSNLKQLNLEEIWNIGYKSSRSAKMSHWTNTLIRDKVASKAELLGVQVVSQKAAYRSQRCSGCGLVRKANRKGKVYQCKSCGLKIDADLNAACNHEAELPEIPWTLRKRNLNRGNGFYWTAAGFFDWDGGSLESLPPAK